MASPGAVWGRLAIGDASSVRPAAIAAGLRRGTGAPTSTIESHKPSKRGFVYYTYIYIYIYILRFPKYFGLYSRFCV